MQKCAPFTSIFKRFCSDLQLSLRIEENNNCNNRRIGHSTALPNLILLKGIPMFNEFVIVLKNDPIKKRTLALTFMEGFHMHHGQILVLEDGMFSVNFIITAVENLMCSCGSEPETTAKKCLLFILRYASTRMINAIPYISLFCHRQTHSIVFLFFSSNIRYTFQMVF